MKGSIVNLKFLEMKLLIKYLMKNYRVTDLEIY